MSRPASGVTFSRGLKNSKTTGQFFLKFYHDIASNLGMCKWFLEKLPKFKMVARGQVQFFCAQKLQNFKSEIIQRDSK